MNYRLYCHISGVEYNDLILKSEYMGFKVHKEVRTNMKTFESKTRYRILSEDYPREFETEEELKNTILNKLLEG